jgi:hypothetical protein
MPCFPFHPLGIGAMTISVRFSVVAIAAVVAATAIGVIQAEDKADTGALAAASSLSAAPAAQRQRFWFDAVLSDHSDAQFATMASGVAPAAYGRSGRAVDFGALDAAQFIAQRAGAARVGDMKAAYAVYQAESACANIEEPVPEFHSAAEREQFLGERARVAVLCAKVSPAQLQERMHFLELAARAGNADAQIDFYMEGPYGKPIDVAENADDPVVKQWKADAFGFLRQAGAQCNHFALSLTANAFDAGVIVERDLKQTMAYTIAAAEARKVTLTPDQMRNQFGDQLSASEFDQALKLGAQIASQSCAR